MKLTLILALISVLTGLSLAQQTTFVKTDLSQA
jgi:hypothetical protein